MAAVIGAQARVPVPVKGARRTRGRSASATKGNELGIERDTKTRQGSRKLLRERQALPRHLFPALTGWAKFCRAHGAGGLDG